MGKHLIAPHATSHRPVDAARYLVDLTAAHDAIVSRAVGWAAAVPSPSWGIDAKRAHVDLTDAHLLVAAEKHPMNELMSVCATVERLLDALAWAIGNGWASEVFECNPSTSGESGPPDLRTAGPKGKATFEVSDVVRARDPNDKMAKDLNRLREAPGGVAKFLVSSTEWEGKVDYAKFSHEKVPSHDTIVARVDAPALNDSAFGFQSP